MAWADRSARATPVFLGGDVLNILELVKEVLDAIRVEFSMDEKGKAKISIQKGENRDGKARLGSD